MLYIICHHLFVKTTGKEWLKCYWKQNFYDFRILISDKVNKAYLYNTYTYQHVCMQTDAHISPNIYISQEKNCRRLKQSHRAGILASLQDMIERSLSDESDLMFSCAKCAGPSCEFKPNLILSFHCTRHDPHFSRHCPRQGHGPVEDTATDKPRAIIELITTHTSPPTTEVSL